MKPVEVIRQLQKASEGLRYVSETDYPFTVLHWQDQVLADLSLQSLLRLTGHAPDLPVTMETLETFFAIAAQPQDWHDEEGQEVVRRYQALLRVLQVFLQDVRVYRVGRVTIEVYILGQIANDIAGLATRIVET
ncbi:hypothetical protein BST81_04335 [Leptolyngbya sp. 'hensonii']|uniref:nuclease A inhibitor family protein n=1 Tax=Leptolyngbya sp. 'hensonii' TaxID=1922337 RepID=UPI00094FFF37|nr:nuclease A inhibitor family protein [Leptolyngbya sp. 'hensonii']OLP19768.1 hypothetical protein BST81_04335 [Leptolyngbya sp. 'hensonii']